MSKITAKNLLKLGFKREDNVPLTKEKDAKYHYYVYEINKKCLLISSTNDEKIKGGYTVDFYNIPEIGFNNLKQLKVLIKLLELGYK
jgi:hypothetical protein